MSTTIIKIHGGDYANWHFQAFGTPEQKKWGKKVSQKKQLKHQMENTLLSC